MAKGMKMGTKCGGKKKPGGKKITENKPAHMRNK